MIAFFVFITAIIFILILLMVVFVIRLKGTLADLVQVVMKE